MMTFTSTLLEASVGWSSIYSCFSFNTQFFFPEKRTFGQSDKKKCNNTVYQFAVTLSITS